MELSFNLVNFLNYCVSLLSQISLSLSKLSAYLYKLWGSGTWFDVHLLISIIDFKSLLGLILEFFIKLLKLLLDCKELILHFSHFTVFAFDGKFLIQYGINWDINVLDLGSLNLEGGGQER